MNIAEILKKYPKGTELYSTIFGDVYFQRVLDRYLIEVTSNCGVVHQFFPNGSYSLQGECVLFPSKNQRDWNKFVVPDQNPKYQFKPFDKVLVRDDNEADWKCDFFSNISNSGFYHCINTWWRQCIPYEGNEHLLGTTNKPE